MCKVQDCFIEAGLHGLPAPREICQFVAYSSIGFKFLVAVAVLMRPRRRVRLVLT